MGLTAESKVMTATEFAESADVPTDLGTFILPLAIVGEQLSENKEVTHNFSDMKSRDGACYLGYLGAHYHGIPNKPLHGLTSMDKDGNVTTSKDPWGTDSPPVETKFSGLKYSYTSEGIEDKSFLPNYDLENSSNLSTALRTGKDLFGLCANQWESINRIGQSDEWKKHLATQANIPFDYDNEYIRSDDVEAEKRISSERFRYNDDDIKEANLPLRDSHQLGPSDPSYERESLSDTEQCKRLWRVSKKLARRRLPEASTEERRSLAEKFFTQSLFFTKALKKSSDDLALVVQLEAQGRLVKHQKDRNYAFTHEDHTTPLPGLLRFRYWIETDECTEMSEEQKEFASQHDLPEEFLPSCEVYDYNLSDVVGGGYNEVLAEPEVESRMDNTAYAAMIKAQCSDENSEWGPSDPSYVRKERSRDSMRKRASTIFANMSTDALVFAAKLDIWPTDMSDSEKRTLATNELKKSYLRWYSHYTTSLAQFEVLKHCSTKESVDKVKKENPQNLFSTVVSEESEEDVAIRSFNWRDAMGVSDDEVVKLKNNFELRINRCSVPSSGNPYEKTMMRVLHRQSEATTEEDKANYNPDVFNTSCKEHFARFLEAHAKNVKRISAMIDIDCNGSQQFKNKYIPETWDPKCYAARLHSDALIYNSIKLRNMVENEIQMLRHEVYEYERPNLYPELWIEDTKDCDAHAKMGAYNSTWLKADIDKKRAAIDARNIDFMQKCNAKMEKKYYKLSEKSGVPLCEDFVKKMEGRMKAKKFVVNHLGMHHGFKYHRWHWGKMHKFVGNIVGHSGGSGCFNPDTDTAINIKEALHYTFLSPLQERFTHDYILTRSTACHENEGCIVSFDFVQKKIYLQVDAGDRSVNTYMDLPEFYVSEAVAHAFCAEKEALTFKWCGKNSSYLEKDMDIAACEINAIERAIPKLHHERLKGIESKVYEPSLKQFVAKDNKSSLKANEESSIMRSYFSSDELESDKTDNESDEESFIFAHEDYEGQTDIQGKPNGQGKVKADNTLYEGSWFNGVRHTFNSEKPSVTVYQDGSKHVGCWMNDKKHGHGIEYAADGTIQYEGAYCHGVQIN